MSFSVIVKIKVYSIFSVNFAFIFYYKNKDTGGCKCLGMHSLNWYLSVTRNAKSLY